MKKIIALGAAVQDVFLQGKALKPHREDGELVQEFELGSKNEIDSVMISTGGGATNAAVTFARAGLHTCFIGKIGEDISGKVVLEALHTEGIDTSLIKYDDELGTGYSTILLSPSGERTVLVYRGASESYNLKEEDFHGTRADWMYISSLSGDTAALKTAIKYAKKHDIKVAINPGKLELERLKQLRDLLDDVDILSLNREEMQDLYAPKATSKVRPQELLKEAAQQVPIALLTDGPRGSFATDGTHLFQAGMYADVKVVDRLGAGDAFSSGFVAMIAMGESIERALTYASANSTSVVMQLGAKTGIIRGPHGVHEMPIKVTNL